MTLILHRVLKGRSPVQLGVIATLQVAFVGLLDHVTGNELSFSIFYAIPVAIAAWYAGKRLGIVVCMMSAATWLAVDNSSGHLYSHPTIPFWNATVRLAFFVIIAHLLARLQVALQSLALLARQDGLTGIMNVRGFTQRCDALFDLAKRHDHSLALGYLDLDGFKAINDRLGHSVGDRVLKAVADTLTGRLRASDVGARLGGDEFAILLPETDLSGAKTFFNALHQSLIELAAINGWPLGFSFGVAVFHSPTVSADEAVRYADALMYRVKTSGKDRIAFAEYASVPALT